VPPQVLEGFGHLRFDGLHGDLQPFGDLGVPEVLLAAEQKHFPAFIGKGANGGCDSLVEFFFGHTVGLVDKRSCGKVFNFEESCAEFPFIAKMVEATVADGGGEVGPDGPGGIDRMAFLPQVHEGFLDDLPGGLLIFHEPDGKPAQPGVMGPEQPFEPLFVEMIHARPLPTLSVYSIT